MFKNTLVDDCLVSILCRRSTFQG